MVTVSHNPNLQEIRNRIIQQIRGEWIGNCILILDGFWWELNNEDFQTIGIPSPSRSFNIIFTSRNKDMCKKIGRHHIYHINFLEDEEAWDLFTEQTRMSFQDPNLHKLARKIVDECDGFRTAILTIASALKDKPLGVWEDTLQNLQALNLTQVSDMEDDEPFIVETFYQPQVSDVEKVLFRIRLSYDLLNDNEAQLMFLMSCLFPQDSNVPIEDLVLFGKGLQLFQNLYSMKEARDRVERIVQKLKDSCFLLDGDEDDFVKVESMCHEFGVSVYSNLEHPYVSISVKDINEWPLEKMQYRNCRALSFRCKTVKQHPVHLKCENLHLLQFSCGSDSARLPTGLFKGLKDLKVLSLSIPSLSQPLTVLKQLRTLCVTESTLDNRYKKPRPRIGDLLGDEMENLEIFSFSTARLYDDFPNEMGLLHNLRYLRFNRERLKYIPPGVLSKLKKLEELYLPLDFISWGCKEEGGERINARLSEIDSLQLTALQIGIAKGSILAETLIEKLTRFHVFIGEHVSPDYEFGTCGNSKRSLEVFNVDADDFRVSWICYLARKSETLRLKQVRNLESIITWQPNEFPQWKKICICDCEEIEYLVGGPVPPTSLSQLRSLKLFGLHNLNEIWNGLYFSNLCEIQIMFCRKLKYVFSISMAKELSQLKSLQICFCDEMEAIFHREGNQGSSSIRDKVKQISSTSKSMIKGLFGKGKQPGTVTSSQQIKVNTRKEDEKSAARNAIIFPHLKTMELAYMNNLRSFCAGNHPILLPSLESMSIFQCKHLEAFCLGGFESPLLEPIIVNGQTSYSQ